MALIGSLDAIKLLQDTSTGLFYYVDANGNYKQFGGGIGDVDSVNGLTGDVEISKTNLVDSGLEVITSDTVASSSTSYYYVDTSLNDVTITLNPIGITTKKTWTIKKTSGLNTLYIVPSIGYTIDDDSEGVLITLNQTPITIQFNETNFKIIG